MGTCISKKEGEGELNCCSSAVTTEQSKSEIICGKEQIHYYMNNKIVDFNIDFKQNIITDNSNISLMREIRPPNNYFILLEYYANKSLSAQDTLTPREENFLNCHLSDILPIPTIVETDRLDNKTTREHPNIVYSIHPIINRSVNELDYKNENLIFNDLIQEAVATKNYKQLNLIKKFIFQSSSYEQLIINLVKIYTHENGIYQNINQYLREDRSENFLASTILLMNDAIRSNFSDHRYEAKCYRKANLKQSEFDMYFNIWQSRNKVFCWKSFVSATKSLNSDIKNNFNSSINENIEYNTVFQIEFSSDTWGLDISSYSLSKYDDEIILPSMSIFEISNISRNEPDQTILINLVKLDRNIRARTSKLNATSSWFGKGLKIIEKEINLLNSDLNENGVKYSFIKDDDNFFKLKFALIGPLRTPYSQGIFQVNIFIPEGYPNKIPNIKFATKIYHPNISLDSGDLDTETLEKLWRPSLSIAKLINIIHNLLVTPDLGFTNCNPQPKREYMTDKEKFNYNALEITRRFADFSGKITEYQKLNRTNEYETRLGLLKINGFTSS